MSLRSALDSMEPHFEKGGRFEKFYALYEMVMMRLARDVPVWYSGHTATLLAAESNILGVNGWVLPDGTLGAGFPSAVARWGQVFIDD